MTTPASGPPGGSGVSDSTFHGPTAFQTGHGSHQTNYYQAAPRPPVSWPHQVGVIPSQAQCFQHRTAVEQLQAAVTDGRTAVLAGTGGVGKTQLAAHHTRRAWAEGGVDLLAWVTASTRTAIVTGYAQAAADVLGADPADPEQAARAFLAWLEPKPPTAGGSGGRRWLIVLDDVAEPADLRDLWPPASPSGRTLATTRRRDAALTGPSRRLVTVGLFTPAEAIAYLTDSLAAHGRHEPPGELAGLAADLGHLPLALSQAAAYLTDADLDATAYRRLLADRASRLPDLLPDPSALPDDQPTPVAAAWSLSIDRADQLRPAGLARPMLRLTAMLDPNGIPATVLTSTPALAYLTTHRTSTDDGGGQEQADVTAAEAVGVLRALHRLSLIDHTPDTPHQAVRVHQLIQRSVRDPLPTDWYDQLARTAADALAEAWPEVTRDTALAQTLRANATTLIRHAEDALYRPDAHPVLFHTGTSLGETGQVTAATTHYQHLADTAHRHLGPDHPDTLTARSHLAAWRGWAGDVAGAVTAFEQLLADRERVLGPDHPDTLTDGVNLATLRGDAGDAAGAATTIEQLLEHMLRVLGPDHPHTLTTRANLALWREKAGDAAGAVTAAEQLLADRERVLGPDHPDTLTTRHNLASSRGEADAAGAVAAFEQLLADRERVQGPDHPHTLTTRHNLATWRGDAGDAAGAATTIEQLLEHMLRVLGPDHPDTLTTRRDLAHWRGQAGDVAGAVAAFEQLLADRERVLGPDHPDTLTTRRDLADWRGQAGDAAGAVAAFEQLLADREQMLGPDHPHTLTTRHNLAHWRARSGDVAGAVAAFEQLLADREQMLGPDHPHTLITRRNLASLRGQAGDVAGAVAAFKRLLEHMLRVLGPDHPHIRANRGKRVRVSSNERS